MTARDEFLTGFAAAGGRWSNAPITDLSSAVATEGALPVPAGPDDRRRRIYIDGKGDGWIDLAVDPETGERELTGITNPWRIATAEEVRSGTGGLTEIGRCW